MTRIFGQYFSAEMAFLCLIEWALTSAVIYALLVSATASDAMSPLGSTSAGSVAILLALTIGAVAVAIGLYRPEICLERGRLLVNAGIAGVLAFPALLLVSKTLDVDLNGGYRLWVAEGLIAWVACLLITRWIFSFAMRHRIFVRRVVVLGNGREASRTREQILSQRGKLFELVAPEAMAAPRAGCSVSSGADAGGWPERARADRIWGIVVAPEPEPGPESEPCPADWATPHVAGPGVAARHAPSTGGLDARGGLAGPALLDLKLRGIRVFDEMSFWEQHLGRINLDRLDERWLTYADGFSNNSFNVAAKRLMDILVSLAVMVLTLPLMLITALLIKLDSKGPVFYRQERVGLHGRPFTLFKFRSMKVDAEAGGRPRWASRKDPRVTRVGGFIRSTRIDELPQLINVLRGEMSFVGPRPERPHFVEQLAEIIPFYHERSYVKPGITGWAQVNFPYGASVEDARQKLSYDLYYVKNRSLFLDILILFSTVRVILFREGAR